MQTPLNSLETKAVISETLERDPSFSFLHQLQNHHISKEEEKKEKNEKKGESVGGKEGTRLQLQLPRNTSSALLPEAAVSSAGSGRRSAQSRGRGSPRRGPSSLSRLRRRGLSRARRSAGQSRSPTDTSARRAGSHPLPPSPPNRSPASRSAPPRLTPASPTQQVPAAASCSRAPQPRGAGGRAEGTLGKREEREASPPLGDVCRDLSRPSPSSPPASVPPRAVARCRSAGSRPRPAAVPGPPPHPAPAPAHRSGFPAASLVPLGFRPEQVLEKI
ncbi:atherin-like [Strigops habroptila]|uniref:atherin-like n=1 Tax=Strigops habroptila TaxID=2489341 RepID=UPI0011CF1343|nr:atherin-like [Strigops habroptila]